VTVTALSPIAFRLDRTDHYLLKAIYLHNGVEHTDFIGVDADAEMQFLLQSVTTGQLVLLCVLLQSSEAGQLVSPSIATSVLSHISTVSSMLSQGSLSTVPIDASATLMAPGIRLDGVQYTGSLPLPPCMTGVTVLVSNTVQQVPTATIMALSLASGGIRTARPLQQGSPIVTLMSLTISATTVSADGLVTPTPPAPTRGPQTTTIVRVVVANPVNDALVIAIISLSSFCFAMVLAMVALLLVRLEFFDVPLWLGGLRRRVEWWENPKCARTTVDSDDEFNSEEDEDGDDGDVGDDEMSAVPNRDGPEADE